MASSNQVRLWESRTQEQDYALLTDPDLKETNRYGQKIDLIELTEQQAPEGRSMYINENPAVGCNPNRNKQHGFYFNADNCIGCHACESACAEKNDTPSHLAFRSVGYVEGGTYPDYQRLNISMACNHCDDPVCLKGCPTGAYTKHAEYGAVLQDPETCFGCGYCTWVCPYNAPQLDPIEGQVSKCNMCVDRLEVGLKPACVSACVGNALDFGVIENIPQNRFQAETQIPGFPDPEITHPNIRFQQALKLPDEMKRTDSAPVKYYRGEAGPYKPVTDKKQGSEKYWNLGRLSSRENPLVLFTLLTQASMGAFFLVFLGIQTEVQTFVSFSRTIFHPLLLIVSLGLVSIGLFMSTMHLGKPMRFYRGFNNLRYSPVCREGLGVALYMGCLGLHLLILIPVNAQCEALIMQFFGFGLSNYVNPETVALVSAGFGWLALPCALAGLYYMNRCYRIPARPFWNHWQVVTSFFGNALSLGAILTGGFVIPALMFLQQDYLQVLELLGVTLLMGVVLEAIGLYAHQRDMSRASHEGGASHYIQTTTFGHAYMARNILLGLSALGGIMLLCLDFLGLMSAAGMLGGFMAISLCIALTSLVGRALFYVLVIPTTMPGAFFWKNKAFEDHARDIGLADMPQVGVVPLH